MSADDEVRLLHEAYQFLVRKYRLQSSASDVKGLQDDGLDTDEEEEEAKEKTTKDKLKGKSKKKFDFKAGPDDMETDDDDDVFEDAAIKPEEEAFGFLRA